MHRIVNIQIMGGYLLNLKFSDGESRTIDFKPLIGEGISAALLDTAYFQLVKIDNGGGIEWPNGMDFCPNFLKDYVAAKELVM